MALTQTWVVAVDVGGTFTDAVAIGSEGGVQVAKVISTPADPSQGLEDALGVLGSEGVQADDIRLLSHGTTVATNAILTRRRTRVVLLATEGFRDILGYRNGTRPDIYNLEPERPGDLVDRSDRLEVHERIGGQGEVVTPLTKEEIERVVDEVVARDPEAVAVALLFSYLDDRHERALGRALRRKLPGIPITLSAETAREFREYPRTATAVVNAALRPVVGRYLLLAKERARRLGVRAPFLVMQSNGGCVPADRAEREAHRLVLSGPAAGVTGLVALGRTTGTDRLISLDMGGTSLDVCLVSGDVVPVVPTKVVDGHPILSPSVNIETVGAGGGSIARVDRAGRLQVGPESAGAEPGPACYGQGGVHATVTDAHVVMGTLGPDVRLAGRLPLDAAAARRAVAAVGDDLGMSPEDAARGILSITLAHMARALRRVSVERGIDPSDYSMVAFGGAGPLHASMLMRELRLASVLIPLHPGLFSAAGLVAADLRIDDSRTVLRALEPQAFPSFLAWFRESGSSLTRQLRQDGVARDRIRLVPSADIRYAGQGYDLNVPLSAVTMTALRLARRDFDELHRSVYGHANSDQGAEVVAVRMTAFGGLRPPPLPTIARGRQAPPPGARLGTRTLILPADRRPVRATVWQRSALLAVNRIEGPAILEQMDATTLVLRGQTARVDAHGNVWIRESAR